MRRFRKQKGATTMCHVQSGQEFEELVLGECSASVRGYLSWNKAIVLARKSQPKKKASVAAILEREVARLIGGVQYFTAVRTPLDHFHGVDAFFEHDDMVVTIDLTMNSKKDCCKADLLVVFDEVTSLDAVYELAGRIAREFQSKERRAYR